MEDNQISLYGVMIFDHYIMFIRSQVILMIIL
jgi:hypothetical protein